MDRLSRETLRGTVQTIDYAPGDGKEGMAMLYTPTDPGTNPGEVRYEHVSETIEVT